jgi:WD40 repeat protein
MQPRRPTAAPDPGGVSVTLERPARADPSATEPRLPASITLPGAAPASITLPEAARPADTLRTPPPALPPGDDASALRLVARESYVVEGEYARGGLGRVLLARDPCLDRPVALKEVLRAEPATIARFVREARITARLQHPNIVPVYEAGRWPSGEPFYAMRLISGRSLGAVVKGMTTLEERLSLVPSLVAVASAVAYAHSLRIIHRDLKPENVLVGAFGETVVIDWGLAKDLAAGDDEAVAFGADAPSGAGTLTVAGARVGTPAYMAPEQARGEPVDARADVFALGALMYHVLGGEAPFRGRSAEDVLALAATAAPADLEAVQPGVPRDLATIVRKAMAPRPADRYPTAGELADDLRRFQTGQLVSARRYSRRELLGRWLGRHRVAIGVAAASLLALAAVTTLSLGRVFRERDRAEARTGELILAQARLSLDRDPTASAAWLKSYPVTAPGWSTARILADDARYAGVARHVFAAPGDGVVELSFEGDGRHAVLFTDGRLLRWDLLTGAAAGAAPVEGLPLGAFVPGSGELILTTRDGGLDLVRAPGAPPRRLDAIPGGVRALATSDDGRWIAASGEPGLVIAAVTGDARRRLPAPPSGVVSLALSADGARLAATTEDRTPWVWDLADGAAHRLEGHLARTSPLFFLAGGAHLAGVGDDGALLVWSAPFGAARALRGDPHAEVTLAASPDGAHLASANVINEVRLWDVLSGEGRVVGAHQGRIQALRFSPDGNLLASSGQDESVHLFRVDTGETATLRGHGSVDSPLTFSPDGRLLATVGGSEVRVWAVRPPLGRTLRGHEGRVTHAVFSPDGRQLATCSEHGVWIWDVATGALVRTGNHDAEAYGLSFSPDGAHLASASFDATVRVWDTHGDGVRVLRGHQGRVRDVVFAPDGRALATAGRDGTVRVWDPATGEGRVLGHVEGQLARIAYSPDGKLLVTAGQDHAVRLWDATTGSPRLLGTHVSDPFHAFFLRGGAEVISASDDETKLWDLATGVARTLPAVPDFSGRVDATPDGRTVALTSGDRIVLVDVATARQRVLVGHDRPVHRCRFSHDGRRLVSVSLDGTVRVWDVAAGTARIVHRHEGVVFDATFSPDDRLIASAGVDKTAWVGPADGEADDALPAGAAGVKEALSAWTTAAVGADNRVRTP